MFDGIWCGGTRHSQHRVQDRPVDLSETVIGHSLATGVAHCIPGVTTNRLVGHWRLGALRSPPAVWYLAAERLGSFAPAIPHGPAVPTQAIRVIPIGPNDNPVPAFGAHSGVNDTVILGTSCCSEHLSGGEVFPEGAVAERCSFFPPISRLSPLFVRSNCSLDILFAASQSQRS